MGCEVLFADPGENNTAWRVPIRFGCESCKSKHCIRCSFHGVCREPRWVPFAFHLSTRVLTLLSATWAEAFQAAAYKLSVLGVPEEQLQGFQDCTGILG